MRKVQVFFLKNSREIGGKGSIPSRRHPMGVGGLYNPRTCRAGPACPAVVNAHRAAGHMGPALQVHTPPKKTTRRPLRGAARFPSMCGTDGGGLYSPLLQAGTAWEIPPDVERIRSAYLEIV